MSDSQEKVEHSDRGWNSRYKSAAKRNRKWVGQSKESRKRGIRSVSINAAYNKTMGTK